MADVHENCQLEKRLHGQLAAQNLTDFVICGGGFEGHKIMKEVNFSDTCIKQDGICRIPGTYRGKSFSTVNAHGWFSYEVKVKPGTVNTLVITAAGSERHIDFDITIGSDHHKIRDIVEGKTDYTFTYQAGAEEAVRVRFDRISGYTPFIYAVKVL